MVKKQKWKEERQMKKWCEKLKKEIEGIFVAESYSRKKVCERKAKIKKKKLDSKEHKEKSSSNKHDQFIRPIFFCSLNLIYFKSLHFS